jgi:hypothetical protein
MASACEVCGGRRVVEREVEGVLVGECGLCGALQGDDEAVALAERRREARRRGIDPRLEPLVRALEEVPSFRVVQSDAGDVGRVEYPYVFLRLDRDGLPHLERLLTSLEMANRETRRRWVVEAALQHGLLFILRPRFWKRVQDITSQDIAEAQSDLGVLGRVLGRDVRLPWWQAGVPPGKPRASPAGP